MAFQLTDYDQLITNSVLLAASRGVNPVNDFPNGKGDSKINFQFPPIIKTESKKLHWQEDAAGTVNYEPIYHNFSAMPREISISWVYIVGGPGDFSAQKVAKEIRQIKAYFYNNSNVGQLPVFSLIMYQHAPPTGEDNKFVTTWRGTDVSFKFGDALITDPGPFSNEAGDGGLIPANTYPLRTDVTLKLALTTRIKTGKGSDTKNIFTVAGEDPKGPPKEKMPTAWY